MALIYNAELTEGFTYIPRSERGQENPFSVKIKPLDSVAMVRLQDGLYQRSTTTDSVSLRTGSYNVSVLEASIIGWDNLTDQNGKQIPIKLIKAGTISRESLNKIPSSMFDELSSVVIAVSSDPANLQIFVGGDDEEIE